MNSYSNFVDFPLTKDTIESKDFMDNVYRKIKECVYDESIKHFTNDITHKFLQTIILSKVAGPVKIFGNNMKKDKKYVYNFKDNTLRGWGIAYEIINIMNAKGYTIQGIQPCLGNNYQGIANEEDVVKVTKKIVEKLKERFPDCLIESDMLSTYIVIDWN